MLQARWEEINLANAVWTIPAEHMKACQEHRIPLSDAALNILKSLPQIEGNAHVFPGARYGKPLSNMALLQLMRKMGYGPGGERVPYVPHGFRSSFRDRAGEVSSFPRDEAVMALAHVIENEAEAACRRGDLFVRRRKMMQAWVDFLDTGMNVANKVLPLKHQTGLCPCAEYGQCAKSIINDFTQMLVLSLTMPGLLEKPHD